MPSITCYGGVGQVGGNKLLVEDGEARLFLDFGKPFAQWGRFYEEYLKPRPAFGLLDVLRLGLLPPLEGLYRPDMELPGLWKGLRQHLHYRDLREKPPPGVVLTHGHLDHTGYVSFLREDAPLLTSALTAFIVKAIQDSGVTDFESEVAYLVPREPREGLLTTADYRKNPAQQRPFHLFDLRGVPPEAEEFWGDSPGGRGLRGRSLKEAEIATPLEVRYFPVDHSIPGAGACAVRTAAGWIAYTGDLRQHGASGEATRRFVQEMKALRPAALLCEGTRLGEQEEAHNYTEADVEERARQELRQPRGLVIADFGPRNVERLQVFHRLAQEVGRALVVLPRDAYLLDAAHLVESAIPTAAQQGLLIYAEPRASPQRWERGVRERHRDRLVSPGRVREAQDHYILCFSFFDLNELPSIQPDPGGLYLYSSHEAFDEERQIDMERLRNWLEEFQMQYVGLPLKELDWKRRPDEEALHASGHMPHRELLEMVGEIAPRLLIPIHVLAENYGEFQRHLAGTGIEVRIPELGVPIALG